METNVYNNAIPGLLPGSTFVRVKITTCVYPEALTFVSPGRLLMGTLPS